MSNKGQIISFFVVLAVIVGGAWQAVSHGEDLRISKKLSQPALIAQQPQQPSALPEVATAPVSTDSERAGETKCQAEECQAEMPEVLPKAAEIAFVVIDDGSDDPKEFVFEVTASTTAMDLIQGACLSSGLVIESREYDFGVFVEAINGKRNSQEGKYWLFYVNSELSQATPDKVQISSGDKIEFNFAPR